MALRRYQDPPVEDFQTLQGGEVRLESGRYLGFDHDCSPPLRLLCLLACISTINQRCADTEQGADDDFLVFRSI